VTRLIKIQTLDNRVLASTTPFLEGRWSWMQDVIAAQFDCSVDDVTAIEDDGDDLIAVRGQTVARVITS
jgi:hypothetical protein